MRARTLAALQAHLRRRPEDGGAWLELAHLVARTGVHPTGLRRVHLERLLALWAEAPEERDLARLVLPLRELEPLEDPPEAASWWREGGRSRVGADGPYDAARGLPLAARHARTGKLLLWVPPGRFTMGSLASRNQQPLHPVEVSGFWVTRLHVTAEDFAAFLGAGGLPEEVPAPLEWEAQLEEPERPVVWLRPEAAEAYCAWAGGRLPTEAEWEYMARGDDGRFFPWGDALPHPSRVNLNPGHRDHADWERWLEVAGGRPADVSPFGVRDLGGNARDWTADWLGSYPEDARLRRDPRGPAAGTLRVVRGCSWVTGKGLYEAEDGGLSHMRASTRWGQAPASVDGETGFRMVRGLVPGT